MAIITLPFVIDPDDLHKMIDEKIAELKTQYIPKADYENRLKADLVAMLTELQLEIEESESLCNECDYAIDDCTSRAKVNNIIQQEINSLKEAKDGKNND